MWDVDLFEKRYLQKCRFDLERLAWCSRLQCWRVGLYAVLIRLLQPLPLAIHALVLLMQELAPSLKQHVRD